MCIEMIDNKFTPGAATSGKKGGLGSQRGTWGPFISSTLLRFYKDGGNIGICLLFPIFLECSKYFLI